jgi:hypothetical protein
MAKRHSDQLESLLTMEPWTFGLKLKVKSENLFFLAVAQSLETFARAAGKVFVVSMGTDRGFEVALRAIQPFCVDRALRDAVSALPKAQPQSVGGASVGGSSVSGSGVGGDEEDDSSYEEEVAIVKTKLDSLQALINALAQSKSKDSTALIHTQLEAQVKELVESLPDEEAPVATAAPPIVAPAQPPPPTAKSWDVELQELAAATARLFTVRIIEEVLVHFGLDGTSAEAARLSAVNAACAMQERMELTDLETAQKARWRLQGFREDALEVNLKTDHEQLAGMLERILPVRFDERIRAWQHQQPDNTSFWKVFPVGEDCSRLANILSSWAAELRASKPAVRVAALEPESSGLVQTQQTPAQAPNAGAAGAARHTVCKSCKMPGHDRATCDDYRCQGCGVRKKGGPGHIWRFCTVVPQLKECPPLEK